MKNREAISEIIGDLRALQVTQRISERYVLSKLKHYNAVFLKRENDNLRLFFYDNVWFTVEGIVMENVPYNLCADVKIPRVTNYMRSKEPIPEMYSYKNGPLIKELVSMDEGNIYTYTTLKEYLNISKREFQGTKRYFWMRNGHLIIPNSSTESVTLTACFRDNSQAKIISNCDCTTCIEPLDEEFPCPEHLFQVVKDETTKDLFTYYKSADAKQRVNPKER